MSDQFLAQEEVEHVRVFSNGKFSYIIKSIQNCIKWPGCGALNVLLEYCVSTLLHIKIINCLRGIFPTVASSLSCPLISGTASDVTSSSPATRNVASTSVGEKVRERL